MEPIITAYNYILSWDFTSSPDLLKAIQTIIQSGDEKYAEPLQNVLLAISEETEVLIKEQKYPVAEGLTNEPLLAVDSHGRAIVGTLPELKLVRLD